MQFFMLVPFLFFTTKFNGRRQAGFRYPISPERAVSNLILVKWAHSAIAECCRFPAQHSGAPTLVVEGYIGSFVSRRATYGRFIAASTRHVMKTTAKPSPVIRASNRESICFSCRSGCLLTQAA